MLGQEISSDGFEVVKRRAESFATNARKRASENQQILADLQKARTLRTVKNALEDYKFTENNQAAWKTELEDYKKEILRAKRYEQSKLLQQQDPNFDSKAKKRKWAKTDMPNLQILHQ